MERPFQPTPLATDLNYTVRNLSKRAKCLSPVLNAQVPGSPRWEYFLVKCRRRGAASDSPMWSGCEKSLKVLLAATHAARQLRCVLRIAMFRVPS